MGILEKNEDALKKKNQALFDLYRQKKEEKCETVEVLANYQNEKVICYLYQDRVWRFNSIYHPEKAAKLYAERYGKWKDYAILDIFGLSDGKAVRELIKNCNDTHEVVVYEPCLEIFLTAMKEFDISDLLLLENVYFVINGINECDLQKLLSILITSQNRSLLEQCILPNYDILFAEQCRLFIENMIYFSKTAFLSENTKFSCGENIMSNIFHNFNWILKKSCVSNLCQAFLKLNLERVPAIIVSAGPSLDKNMEQLKKAKGKALIIAVDSSLKALIGHGIQPDLAISIDAKKSLDIFSDNRMFEIPWVVSVSAQSFLVKSIKNRIFFESGVGFTVYSEIIKKITKKDLGWLETGGSVATDALSLALALGFRQIILVGQDLAFTDGKGHVSGFEKSKQADKEHVESRMLIEVEAQDGSLIKTDVQMESYLRWFELCIERACEQAVFYNATEGGAKIKGTVPMTLKEAIEELCIKEMNFSKVIDSVPDTFSEAEQINIREEVLKFDRHFESLERELQKGIEAYDRLIQLEREKKQNTSEYAEIIKVIAWANEIENREPYLQMVKLCEKADGLNMKNDIYEADDLSVIEIAERGKRLLERYSEALLLCKENMEKAFAETLK